METAILLTAAFGIALGWFGGSGFKDLDRTREAREEARQEARADLSSTRQHYTNTVNRLELEIEELEETQEESHRVVTDSEGRTYLIYDEKIWEQK